MKSVISEEPIFKHADDEQIDLLEAAIVLARRRRVIAWGTIIGTLAITAVVLLLPNWYTAEIKILPPQQNQSTAAAMIGQISGLANLAGVNLGSGLKNPNDIYLAMLGSRTLEDNLIKQFDLQKVYKDKYLQDARHDLEDRSDIQLEKNGVITLHYTDRDPKRAADVANAYFNQLAAITENVAVTDASQRRVFYQRELEKEKEDLTTAEIELKKMQEATGMIEPVEQGRAIIDAVAKLKAQITAKEVQVAGLRSFAADRNPDLVRAEQELAALRAQLSQMEKKQNVGEGDILVPTGKVPAVGLEYIRRYRDFKYHETLYEMLAKQFETAKLEEARDYASVQLLDSATLPEKHSKPKRTITVIIGFLCSLFLSVLLALVAEWFEKASGEPEMAGKLQRLRAALSTRARSSMYR